MALAEKKLDIGNCLLYNNMASQSPVAGVVEFGRHASLRG